MADEGRPAGAALCVWCGLTVLALLLWYAVGIWTAVAVVSGLCVVIVVLALRAQWHWQQQQMQEWEDRDG